MSSLAEIEGVIDQLPLDEQEQLLQRLASRLEATQAERFPAREDHVRLLDGRFAAYRDDPSQASTWEEVKRRFEARRG